MKKSLLAVAIPALMTAQAQAVELYNDGVNSVAMGGYLTIQIDDKSGDAQTKDNFSRINFSFDRQLSNGFKLDSRIESQFNMDTDGQAFRSRLGYIGLSHDKYGRISGGKQWSVFYDAEVVTDYTPGFAADHGGIYGFGTDGGITGTGRADKALQYRNNVALGGGDLALGLQWQGAADYDNGKMDDRSGASLVYSYDKLRFAVAYYGGEVGSDFSTGGKEILGSKLKKGDKVEGTSVSFAYGSWGQGLYAAVNYMEGENLEAGYRFAGKSNGLEALLSYTLDNDVNMFTSYRVIKSDKALTRLNRKYDDAELLVGAVHSLASNVETFAVYRMAIGDDQAWVYDQKLDDAFAVGITVYL